MQDARVRVALLVVCLACLLGSGFVLLKGRQSAPPPILFAAPPAVGSDTPPATLSAAAVPRHAKRLYVDVAGAVRRPSLYLLPPDSRVMQAVLAAGGPTAAADLDAVNLAQPVTDGEKVFVPKRGAASVLAPSALPAVMPAASARVTLPSVPSAAKPGKAASGSRSGKMGPGEQIGLNSATLEQLERLPGVGPSMAARILAYRQQSGGFAKIEDLTLVTGIGPKKYAKMAPFLTL